MQIHNLSHHSRFLLHRGSEMRTLEVNGTKVDRGLVISHHEVISSLGALKPMEGEPLHHKLSDSSLPAIVPPDIGAPGHDPFEPILHRVINGIEDANDLTRYGHVARHCNVGGRLVPSSGGRPTTRETDQR